MPAYIRSERLQVAFYRAGQQIAISTAPDGAQLINSLLLIMYELGELEAGDKIEVTRADHNSGTPDVAPGARYL